MEPRDYHLLREIATRVERMDAALFGANEGDKGFVETTAEHIEKHSGRLGRLEKWAWSLTGGGLVVLWIIGHHLLILGK